MSTSGPRTRTPRAERFGALALALALTLAGCQCLPPSIDGPDGSTGLDGGSDAGPMLQACPALDCPVPDSGIACAPSCIGGECVGECSGGRDCQVLDAGRCLSCAGETRCAEASCTPGPRCTFTVENSSCAGLVDDGFRGSIATEADCRGVISGDAGVLGTWYELDVGEAVANIPRLGGTCVAKDQFTGAQRTRFFCPFCAFTAFGCD
ncbi:MAG: hypothetical protein JNK82_11660 [Myxococcaceae bacterium]|nr:hypothetical protein [Myxococcaceae bacterium]